MKNWTSFNKIVRFSIYMTTYIRKHTVLGTHQLRDSYSNEWPFLSLIRVLHRPGQVSFSEILFLCTKLYCKALVPSVRVLLTKDICKLISKL